MPHTNTIFKGVAMNVQAYRNEMGAAVNNDSSRLRKLQILALTAKDKRKAAKMGMTISLGSLVLSGLMHFKGHKSLHTWSGIALLGFSWITSQIAANRY
jgi:hypothetical protein